MITIKMVAHCNNCEAEMIAATCDFGQEPGAVFTIDIETETQQLIFRCPKCDLEHTTGDGVELIDAVQDGTRDEYPEI